MTNTMLRIQGCATIIWNHRRARRASGRIRTRDDRIRHCCRAA